MREVWVTTNCNTAHRSACDKRSDMTDSLQVQLKKGVLNMCVLMLLSKSDNYALSVVKTFGTVESVI
jgi:hypothetical protein